jgi:plasmid replication initiation protein
VTLPEWLFRSVEAMQILTINPDYFQLRKPLARRLYELARKHCGRQSSWCVSMAALHRKSGSTRPLKSFRLDARKLIEEGNPPDYGMTLDSERDMVTLFKKGQAEIFDAPVEQHIMPSPVF